MPLKNFGNCYLFKASEETSMGCYMAYEASTKKPESQRTVVSNIHKRGTPPVEAGAYIVSVAEILFKEKKSGVELKL